MVGFDNNLQDYPLAQGMPLLQMLGVGSLAGLMLALVILLVIVVFGTFLGVLGALRTFFGESSWEAVQIGEEE